MAENGEATLSVEVSIREGQVQDLTQSLNQNPVPNRAREIGKQHFSLLAQCPPKSGTGSEPRYCPNYGLEMTSGSASSSQ